MNKCFQHLLWVVFSLFIIGCGGESSETESDIKLLPIANSGPDQVVTELSLVNLTGSATDSDGTIINYQWSQISGPEITISSPSSENTSFTAPTVEKTEVIKLKLTATDNDNLKGEDTVKITVNMLSDKKAPPIAYAGDDITVDEQTLVHITGLGQDPDSENLTYKWTQASGLAVELNTPNLDTFSFTSPETQVDEVLTFTLTVSDEQGLSSSDNVNVTILPVNLIPTVDAGSDQTVFENKQTSLIGTAIDVDGSIQNYQWVQISGPTVNLDLANSNKTSFITPNLTQATILSFKLTVTDNEGAQASDAININVTPINTSPIANAGNDLSVEELDSVTLTGLGNDGDGTIQKYFWQQTSGIQIDLPNSNQSIVNFKAPIVTQVNILSFSLTVTDNEGASSSDSVTITVNPVNIAPQVATENDKSVEENQSVTLSTTASDQDGSISSYQWIQISGKSINLSDTNKATARFTSPYVSKNEILSFKVTVTDNEGLQASDTINISILHENSPPLVSVDKDKTVNEQTLVTLSGSASDEDGEIDSYLWIQTAGTSVTLTNANSAQTNFTAPAVTQAEILTFQLTVTDNEAATATASINITVEPLNSTPTANAGTDKTVNEQKSVTLSGSATDEDGTIDSYLWTQTAGSNVTLANTNAAQSSFTAPALTQTEILTFQLTVTDNEAATATDTINVTVTPDNFAPIANAGNDQTVLKQTTVNLVGSGTDADGTITTYLWEQVSGEIVTLLNINNSEASFLSPDTTKNETLVFKLTVTDDQNAIGSDTISVLVTNNLAPIADAGPMQNKISNKLITLDASASHDHGGALTYLWKQTDTSGITINLDNQTSVKPKFTAPVLLTKQTLTFELTVTDAANAEDVAQVDINITPSFSINYTTASNSKIIYVSSISGNDATASPVNSSDVKSPTNPNITIYPYKTLAAAKAQLRDGFGDWILLKRGEKWEDESFGVLSDSGRSKDFPILFSFYGSSGARPLIKTGGQVAIHANNQETSYISILGLDFYSYKRDPNSPNYNASEDANTGISFVGGGSNILIEDTIVRYFKNGITVISFDNKEYQNFSLLDSIIHDNYSDPASGHSSGLYIEGVNGITIKNNVFDHNGWNQAVPAATATKFNHNIYLKANNNGSRISVIDNIISRGSSHGIHGRAGGNFTNNFLIENSIGLQLGYKTTPLKNGTRGYAYNNVIYSGKLMDPTEKNDNTSKAVWGIYTETNALDNGGTIELINNIVTSAKDFGDSNVDINNIPGISFTGNIRYNWNSAGDNLDGSWPNPDISIQSYMNTIGYTATFEEFIKNIKERKLAESDDNFRSLKINDYFRSGFNK